MDQIDRQTERQKKQTETDEDETERKTNRHKQSGDEIILLGKTKRKNCIERQTHTD